ncbi:Exoglucanase 1 [Escovopsis weberi]|uniref:Glucanase n=1 Tax=Escovopsis weberi TaxID=150374 RepID=A0A0M8N487_ESCWE|nr:Exoglucanase 1 [Escovopsis weberi]
MYDKLAALSALFAVARAQQACSLTAENHPKLTWSKCSAGGSCTTQNGEITVDANWRWTHSTSGANNCYTGNTWDAGLCPDDKTCAQNCCLDGADYANTYGVTSSGNALSLKFVTQSAQKNIGSRLYLMASETQYQEFQLANNEFTFDVDVSQLPCGLNGALYFVSMDADGGMSKYPGNKAGAKYGTGYCDSQCPRDLKFINGQGNVEGWQPSSNNPNTGVGNHGSCCPEMDIWEANSISNAVTPHPCESQSQTMCNGDNCGGTYSNDRYGGTCDPDGCDLNPYRLGNPTFFGPGSQFSVDTTKKFTVVTQFNSTGNSVTINRFYIQDGVKFETPNAKNLNGYSGNAIDSTYCAAEEAEFGGNSFSSKGGLPQMNKALLGNMVLVLSLWDDYASNMLWLDSTYPVNATGQPGAARGSCSTSSGVPASVEAQSPNSQVIYSNIRFGPIGSTTEQGASNPAPPASSSSHPAPPASTSHSSTPQPPASSTSKCTSPPSSTPTQPGSGNGATQVHYGQCGGIGWTGPTVCESPYTCQVGNPYYSQCL